MAGGAATPKVKLNLGAKRKQSVDNSNGGMAKTIKISNSATAGSAPSGSAGFVTTPQPVKKVKAVTPSTPRPGTKIVVFHLGISASRRAQAIIAAPPQRGRARSIEPPTPQHRTPSISQSVQSPVAASSFATAAPAPNMNLGGFRSFGSAPASSPLTGGVGSTLASPTAFAGSHPSPLTSLTAPLPAKPNSITSLSTSPPAPGPGPAANGASMAPPPPKKKLTLKLSGKSGSANASPRPSASPRGSPGP